MWIKVLENNRVILIVFLRFINNQGVISPMVTFLLFKEHWQENHTKTMEWRKKNHPIVIFCRLTSRNRRAGVQPRNFLLRRSSALAGRRLLAFRWNILATHALGQFLQITFHEDTESTRLSTIIDRYIIIIILVNIVLSTIIDHYWPLSTMWHSLRVISYLDGIWLQVDRHCHCA